MWKNCCSAKPMLRPWVVAALAPATNGTWTRCASRSMPEGYTAMYTGRRILRPYYIIGLAVTTLLLLVVWVRFDSGPSPDHEASQSFLSHARKGELDARDSKDFASSSAGPWAASQEPPRGGMWSLRRKSVRQRRAQHSARWCPCI